MAQSDLYIDRIIFTDPVEENSYLNSIPAVRWLQKEGQLCLRKRITILIGENGSGKSTLLEAIAVAFGFNPEGGTLNFRFSTENSHSELFQHIRLSRRRRPRDGFFLRAESFYNMATYIDRHDADPESGTPIIPFFGGVSLHHQSHGESFLSAVQNRFGGHGLYLFDEPESALSPQKLLTLLVEFDRLIQSDSQILLATHSPILMAFPNAEILELNENGIRQVRYTETEQYQITKEFLNNPERMLRYLLDD